MLGADRFTSTGRVEGRPDSRAVFAWNAGYLHASVDDGERGNHVLRVATAEFAQVYRVDPDLVAPCGGQKKAVVDGAVLTAAARRAARGAEIGQHVEAMPATDGAAGVEVHGVGAHVCRAMGGRGTWTTSRASR